MFSMHWTMHLDCVAFRHEELAAVDASVNLRFLPRLVQATRQQRKISTEMAVQSYHRGPSEIWNLSL